MTPDINDIRSETDDRAWWQVYVAFDPDEEPSGRTQRAWVETPDGTLEFIRVTPGEGSS